MSVPDWGMVKRVRHAGPVPRRSARADLDLLAAFRFFFLASNSKPCMYPCRSST